MTTLGEKVKQLRTEQGWTLHELSTRAHLSLSYISAIEANKRPNPSFRCVEQLARAFAKPLAHFVSTVEDDTNGPGVRPDQQTFLAAIERMYDVDMQAFIAAESSRPYVSFARTLAQDQAIVDASRLLQLVAQFLQEQKQPYQ